MCNKRPHFQHFNQIYQKRNNPIGSSLFMHFLKYILCLTQKKPYWIKFYCIWSWILLYLILNWCRIIKHNWNKSFLYKLFRGNEIFCIIKEKLVQARWEQFRCFSKFKNKKHTLHNYIIQFKFKFTWIPI